MPTSPTSELAALRAHVIDLWRDAATTLAAATPTFDDPRQQVIADGVVERFKWAVDELGLLIELAADDVDPDPTAAATAEIGISEHVANIRSAVPALLALAAELERRGATKLDVLTARHHAESLAFLAEHQLDALADEGLATAPQEGTS